MFERFSAKSLKAVDAAKQLADQLKDESVATGHLIYGLTIDRSVCLHHIFRDLNVDPDMFAGYVQSLPREPEESSPGAPFNRHCQTVFERSRETADQIGADIVEPEHLALSIFSVKSGSCYETLKEFSIDPDYVTMLVMESMGLEVEDAPDWF